MEEELDNKNVHRLIIMMPKSLLDRWLEYIKPLGGESSAIARKILEKAINTHEVLPIARANRGK